MARTLLPPFEPTTPDAVRFEDLGDRLRLEATESLEGVSSGVFAQPTVFASLDLARLGDPALVAVGYSFTQFAMPVRGGTSQPVDWNPADNVHSPPAVLPVLLRSGSGLVCLLAPLDCWHEQIIAVDQHKGGITGLRWGWHGDLDQVPAGTTTTLGIYEGSTATEVFRAWASDLGSQAESRSARASDPLVTHLSYWTDNGSAYWYRTEPGLDITETLGRKRDEFEELGVGVRSFELDSWFYPHEVGRAVSEIGYLEEVPPTGMLAWQPRPDVLPAGIDGLADRLGRPPLVLHARHISPQSPYVESGEWWIDLAAHPADPSFFGRWIDDAASWGATCIELDWMIMTWFGVRQLRSRPGRALAWQRALNGAAAERGLTLLWCMASPADMLAAGELNQVVALRTSDDYRYADDPARLWTWYLTVNRLADAVGLPVFKDCFFTATDPGPSGIDGDPHAGLESLLAAFSAGVVGIGDRLGRTDPSIVARVCRPDGLLLTPDRPAVLADQSFFPPGELVLTWAVAESGPWRYVVTYHGSDEPGPIQDGFELGGRCLVYDWRRKRAIASDHIEVALDHRDWALYVCCPITLDGGVERATIGDPTVYATMAKQRFGPDLVVDQPRLAAGEVELTIREWRADVGIVDRSVGRT